MRSDDTGASSTVKQSEASRGRAFSADMGDCRRSVLAPDCDLGISPPLRRAIAARVCRIAGQEALAAEYADGLEAVPAMVASGANLPGGGAEAAMAAQADLVSAAPARAGRSDIEALRAAGLVDAQIVALSELIAFANYECRVRHGLDLIGAVA